MEPVYSRSEAPRLRPQVHWTGVSPNTAKAGGRGRSCPARRAAAAAVTAAGFRENPATPVAPAGNDARRRPAARRARLRSGVQQTGGGVGQHGEEAGEVAVDWVEARCVRRRRGHWWPARVERARDRVVRGGCGHVDQMIRSCRITAAAAAAAGWCSSTALLVSTIYTISIKVDAAAAAVRV